MTTTTRLRSSSILARRSILFASFQELYHGKVLRRKRTSHYHLNTVCRNGLHRLLAPNQKYPFGKVFAIRMMLNKLANNSSLVPSSHKCESDMLKDKNPYKLICTPLISRNTVLGLEINRSGHRENRCINFMKKQFIRSRPFERVLFVPPGVLNLLTSAW